MGAQTENSKPVKEKFAAHFVVTAVIGTLLIAFAGMFVVLYINLIRSAQNTDFIVKKAHPLTNNAFGSSLLWLDIICIGVSLLLIATILFVLFYRNRKKEAVKWIDYIEPVSSETIKEYDQLQNRTKQIIDTTKKSEFMDGEYRIRGGAGFGYQVPGSFSGPGQIITLMGDFSLGDRPEHKDSDGDPGH